MESRDAWCWTVLRGARATGAILVDITRVLQEAIRDHFKTLYYRRALVSVRAMVDPNNDSDSLLTLLTDIAAHPGDLETTDSEMLDRDLSRDTRDAAGLVPQAGRG